MVLGAKFEELKVLGLGLAEPLTLPKPKNKPLALDRQLDASSPTPFSRLPAGSWQWQALGEQEARGSVRHQKGC